MKHVQRLAIILFLATVSPTYGSSFLSISPRQEWENNNGYCGECVVQMAALYYGTWISQYRCRAILGDQTQEVLVGANENVVLDALRLKYEQWDYNQPTPQFQSFMTWTKGMLQKKYPVMVAAYLDWLDDPDYDHIVLANGFTGSATGYKKGDILAFNNCMIPRVLRRSFAALPDNRTMAGNGAKYGFAVPTDVDYGCAITGIQDDANVCKRVRLTVNKWSEPNVSDNAVPITLKGTITVSGLVKGRHYVLLRYDDLQNVPTQNFTSSAYTTIKAFVARASTKTFTDKFSSDSVVVYRCVPAGQ